MAQLQTIRDQLSVLYRQRDLLKQALESDFWRTMRGWLTGQIQARKEMAFNNAARSLEDAFAFAGARGEIAGIELAMKWPDIMLESTKREIEATLAQLRAEEEDVEEENGTTE